MSAKGIEAQSFPPIFRRDARLLRRAPHLRQVAFNGAAAETWFRRCFRNELDRPPFAGLVFERLPSTSPAHAGLTPARKLAVWRARLVFQGLKDLGKVSSKPWKSHIRRRRQGVAGDSSATAIVTLAM